MGFARPIFRLSPNTLVELEEFGWEWEYWIRIRISLEAERYAELIALIEERIAELLAMHSTPQPGVPLWAPFAALFIVLVIRLWVKYG